MDFFSTDMRRAQRGYCCVRLCRNLVVRGSPSGRYCRRCRDRRYALSNPVSYAFNKLRNNARRRGHEFSLTRSEFQRICDDYGYLEHTGKTAESLSIDRIDNRHGYHAWNIQVLTLSENSRKQYCNSYQQPDPSAPADF